VIRSTLPPDFIRQLPQIVASRRSTAGLSPIPVMLNPEFTREGRAVRDYQQPDRIVLGVVTTRRGTASPRSASSITRPPRRSS
jgi:UDP-glucose 6-dehydrogenase